MKDENEIDLASFFTNTKEASYDEDFTERVTVRIKKGRRTRHIVKISLAVLGIAVFVGIAPWLMKQTGFVVLNVNSVIQGITLLCLSPAGWIMSSMVLLYSFFKTR